MNWLSNLVYALERSGHSVIVPSMNGNTPAQAMPGNGVVECCSTPCLAMWVTSKERLFDRVGYFDERFTKLSCDDIALCWKLWKSGMTVGVHKDVRFVHHTTKVAEESEGDISAYNTKIPRVRAILNEIYGEKVSHIKPGTDGLKPFHAC